MAPWTKNIYTYIHQVWILSQGERTPTSHAGTTNRGGRHHRSYPIDTGPNPNFLHRTPLFKKSIKEFVVYSGHTTAACDPDI
ncbi:Uncharacterized protein HZ326_19544 [Fusarium oxysporum f. sp. albedinis]|nr:Uncharacterized protein HZ326_19544 [Fusarium oxysporum f. sp. albedinis]